MKTIGLMRRWKTLFPAGARKALAEEKSSGAWPSGTVVERCRAMRPTIPSVRGFLKARLSRPKIQILRTLWDRKDRRAIFSFLRSNRLGLSFAERTELMRRILWIHFHVDCRHTHDEALTIIEDMLRIPEWIDGVFVETGCYKGGSSAKFSLAAKLRNRRLVLFDSFQGIPENREPHSRNIFGGRASFNEGDYAGSVAEVRETLHTYGVLDVCEFKQGWFDETMPSFEEPIAAVYLDVDLAASTETCLKYLYPLVQPGGFIYSQDGHLPLVIDVLRSEEFWRKEVGCPVPLMYGLGRDKLVKIVKQ